MKRIEKIQKAVIRQQLSSRGGGIEIDLSHFGFPKGEKMAAYQNYLGGGLLGSIRVNDTITAYGKPLSESKQKKLHKLGQDLMQYFHSLTNPDSEWESASFEELQRRPSSAY